MATIRIAKTAALFILYTSVWSTLLSPGWGGSFEALAGSFHRAAFAADDDQEKNREANTGQENGGQAPCPPCPDPAKVVLEGLAERRAAIERDGELLEQERRMLAKFKQEIDEKLEALEALKQQINNDIAILEQKKTDQELASEAAFDARMNSLVKVYSGMKPKKAAAIVDEMDVDVAKQIFSRMRESAASEILAFVESEKAAKISERIVFRKK
ncbi:MAG: hypothetical protein RBR67_00700 [Desulfobacterium sp.]|jgi:flagellar motility protein MotE (MotC chaperone)|nr:hypothetical protein [Desulfobacterium sp.]